MHSKNHIFRLALHFQLHDMTLKEVLIQAHYEATEKKATGEHYRWQFTAAILPLIQEIYNIKLSQTEMTRYEKSLWYTVDLWRNSQGIANIGIFLHIVHRFTDKFFHDKATS